MVNARRSTGHYHSHRMSASPSEMAATNTASAAPDGFYRSFEDRFRGSRETIIGRLRAYRSFVEPIAASGDTTALDLGCGRGEWLELLGGWGVNAHGIDLDRGMLRAARQRGLDAREGDLLDELRGTPDASLDIVSAFHVIEHLPFSVLRTLVHEVHRVLRPGGLMILETPNAENIDVGTVGFWTDATHERPVPAHVTTFLAEYAGFGRSTVLRLNGPDASDDEPARMVDVLFGASPDYGMVAQKGDATERALDAAFAASVGRSALDVARDFDRRRAAEVAALRDEHAALRDEYGMLRADGETRYAALVDRCATLEAELVRLSERFPFRWLFFHSSGRPRRLVRTLFFHTSGKPRGIVRRRVVRSDGTPRGAFRRWMESPSYQALRWPSSRRSSMPAAQGGFDARSHPLRGSLLAELEREVAAARGGKTH